MVGVKTVWAPSQAWEFNTGGNGGHHKQLQVIDGMQRTGYWSAEAVYQISFSRTRVTFTGPAHHSNFHIISFGHHYNLRGRSCSHFTGGQSRITKTQYHRADEDQRQNGALGLSTSHTSLLSTLPLCWMCFMLFKKKLLFILFPCHWISATAAIQPEKNAPDSH